MQITIALANMTHYENFENYISSAFNCRNSPTFKLRVVYKLHKITRSICTAEYNYGTLNVANAKLVNYELYNIFLLQKSFLAVK